MSTNLKVFTADQIHADVTQSYINYMTILLANAARETKVIDPDTLQIKKMYEDIGATKTPQYLRLSQLKQDLEKEASTSKEWQASLEWFKKVRDIYPDMELISWLDLARILLTYDLYMGRLSDYVKDIPAENIQEIHHFKSKMDYHSKNNYIVEYGRGNRIGEEPFHSVSDDSFGDNTIRTYYYKRQTLDQYIVEQSFNSYQIIDQNTWAYRLGRNYGQNSKLKQLSEITIDVSLSHHQTYLAETISRFPFYDGSKGSLAERINIPNNLQHKFRITGDRSLDYHTLLIAAPLDHFDQESLPRVKIVDMEALRLKALVKDPLVGVLCPLGFLCKSKWGEVTNDKIFKL